MKIRKKSIKRLVSVPLAALSLLGLFLSACGGGGSDSSTAIPTTAVTGTINAGPIAGAQLLVRDSSGRIVAGPVATGPDGGYMINVPTSLLSADLTFESTGGTFTDEATGNTTSAGPLSAIAPGGGIASGTAIHLTPATAIAEKLVRNHGKTPAEAATAFNSAFGFNPDYSVPPTNAPAVGQDFAKPLAGLRAAAFSQLTKDLNLVPDRQFALLTALSQDLADGILDGKNAGAPVTVEGGPALPEDIQLRFVGALTSFCGCTRNLTGLKADKLGALPFAKVALTDSYRVEYLPGAKPSAEGKTAFTLKVDSRADGSAVPGLRITLKPVMNMAAMSHGSPVDEVVDNGDGTYSLVVYYLMSSMMNGQSMGYWKLDVAIGSPAEEAAFYPPVGMLMGGVTAKAALKGQNDQIPNMGTPANRSYYLFPAGVTGSGGGHDLSVFIAAKESNSLYPPVDAGTVLHDEAGAEWSVATVVLEFSTDAASWTVAQNNGGGHFTAVGVSGLAADAAKPVYLRLTVNGELKTTNGSAPDTTNEYATVNVKAPQ